MSKQAAVVVVVVVVVVALVCGGCPPRDGDARDLAVWSNVEARRVVELSLKDLERGDRDDVVRRFCDVSPDGLRKASELLAPAEGRPGLRVRRVEPAWVGKEPFFYVEVGDRDVGDAEAGWVHGLGVRVRDGCLDRAVGASHTAATPATAIKDI